MTRSEMKILQHEIYGTVLVDDPTFDDDTPMVKVRLVIPHRTPRGELWRLTVSKSALSDSGGYTRPNRIKSMPEKFIPFAKARAAKYARMHGLEFEEVLSTCLFVMVEVSLLPKLDNSFVAVVEKSIALRVINLLKDRTKERKVRKLPPEMFYPEPSAYAKIKELRIVEALTTLVEAGEVSERDANIVRRIYLSDKTATQQEIADELGLSQPRIVYITQRVTGMLRELV